MGRRPYNNDRHNKYFRRSKRNDPKFDMDMDFDDESISGLESKMHHSDKKHKDDSHCNVEAGRASTCQRLANVINGEVVQSAPVCVVMHLRDDIRATILGRRTISPLALPFILSFEDNGLNLGETVLLQKEVNPMLDALRKRGLIVTAFHNHWLFEEPRLMYMHWENVGMSPFEFARASRAAAKEARLF